MLMSFARGSFACNIPQIIPISTQPEGCGWSGWDTKDKFETLTLF